MADNRANDIKYYSKSFPSPIAPNSVKDTKEFGLACAKAIHHASCYDGENSYYQKRNEIFRENRLFGAGKQTFDIYKRILGIDEGQLFFDYKYYPRPIAPHFCDVLINKIMDRMEKVEVTGLSLEINERKERKRSDASFRMENKAFIEAQTAKTGIQLEPPDAYTPETKEELDLWSELNDKEREEILMEEGIDFVMYNNDWDSIKKEIATDFVFTGFGWAQNYFDGSNRIRVQRRMPDQMLYPSTNSLDFRNVPYLAHMEQVSIVDARCMFPNIPEKELWSLARSYRDRYSNSGYHFNSYEDAFGDAYNRPYDGYVVDILFFEYRVTKYINYVTGKDGFGKPIFEFKGDRSNPENPNKKMNSKPIPTIYAGAWLVGTDILPKWGEMENLLRNNEDKEDVKFSYSGYMLNNDGTMFPSAPVSFMKPSIINMDVMSLRIQNHAAMAAPDGVRIELGAIKDLDLGKGIGKVTPAILKQIRLQQGDEYWRRLDKAGNEQGPPLEDAIHPMGDKLMQFINVYNWEYDNIRKFISVNEALDGVGVGERKGAKVMQQEINGANLANYHIYGGYLKIYLNTCKGVGMRLWHTLKRANANSMYMEVLGRKNRDFIRRREEITRSNYDLKFSVNMSDEERQNLNESLMIALQQGAIQFEDKLYIEKIFNYKRAIAYLELKKKQRAKEAASLSSEQQAQAQKIAGDQALEQQQMKVQSEATANETKLLMKEMEYDQAQTMEDLTLIRNSILEFQKNGTPVPPYVDALIAEVQERKLSAQQAKQAQIMQQQLAEMEEAEANGEMPVEEEII